MKTNYTPENLPKKGDTVTIVKCDEHAIIHGDDYQGKTGKVQFPSNLFSDKLFYVKITNGLSVLFNFNELYKIELI